MISAFGPRAERIRSALPPDMHVVAFDETGVAAAFVECVARRERGERFYALPLMDNLRVSAYTGVAAVINAQLSDRDQRYASGKQLGSGELEVNGGPARRLHETDPRPWSLIFQVLTLADELLVRSFFEYTTQYAMQMNGRRVRRILLEPSTPAFVPQRVGNPSVVVWTGRRTTPEAALALIGLEEFRGDVAYVGDAPLANVRARFVSRTGAEVDGVLSGAGCIVCIDPADPADAVALARCGASVVAPITCGAVEFVEDITTWDAANTQTLYSAVAIALGRIPAGANMDIVPPQPAGSTFSLPAQELPLVTIITATFNRRKFLREMLTCLAAQTYPNIESVVVNDAGEPVDDIVAEFPFARIINLDRNRGTLGALEFALAEARGEYIGLLPDDDWLYPDHVERLMSAILRSGAAVAHTHSLLRFLERDGNGLERTAGFNAVAYAGTVTPTQALISTCVGGHQCLQRRDTFAADDVGWYVSDSIVADQEYHMRLVERHQLVRVDQFTCEFRDHAGNTGKNHDWAQAVEHMYEKIHPVSDRPLIDMARRATVEAQRKIPVGSNVNGPTLRL